MWGSSAAEAIRMADEAKTISTSALARAESGFAELNKHAEVCAQRQGSIITDLKEIKELVKRVTWALLAAGAVLAYNTLKVHGVFL